MPSTPLFAWPGRAPRPASSPMNRLALALHLPPGARIFNPKTPSAIILFTLLELAQDAWAIFEQPTERNTAIRLAEGYPALVERRQTYDGVNFRLTAEGRRIAAEIRAAMWQHDLGPMVTKVEVQARQALRGTLPIIANADQLGLPPLRLAQLAIHLLGQYNGQLTDECADRLAIILKAWSQPETFFVRVITRLLERFPHLNNEATPATALLQTHEGRIIVARILGYIGLAGFVGSEEFTPSRIPLLRVIEAQEGAGELYVMSDPGRNRFAVLTDDDRLGPIPITADEAQMLRPDGHRAAYPQSDDDTLTHALGAAHRYLREFAQTAE